MGLKFEKDTGELRDCMLVHEPGQPGSLVIDREHGVILTPNMERPDWADGLVVALLDEHRNFYTTRLGSYSAPEIFARSDLSWVGLNEEGTEIEVEADSEYRMDTLAASIGEIDREEGTLNDKLASIEMSTDQLRTDGEVSALEDAGGEVVELNDRAKASA